MKTKKLFSFNEERDAKEIVQRGFPNGDINYSQMYLVAKYFKKILGYGAVRLEKELIRFCKEQDRNFNPIIESEYIKKWVNSAMNYNLRRIDSVIISQKELNVLRQIETPTERKLIFVSFILSKALKKRSTRKRKKNLRISDSYYIHYNNFSDIIKLSKVKNVSETKLAETFHRYKDLFTFYNAEKELIRLDFIEKNTVNGIIVNDLDKVMEHYDMFLGNSKPLGKCTECGKNFIKNSNKQKRCKECSVRLRREQKRLWIKKVRNL